MYHFRTSSQVHIADDGKTIITKKHGTDRIQQGIPADWAVNAMSHELPAFYSIDHARTLAMVVPGHYRYNFEIKKEKLAQYSERIWNITEGNVEEKAKTSIEKMEEFFHSPSDAKKMIEMSY